MTTVMPLKGASLMYYPFYFDPTYILMLIPLVVTMIAQARVSGAFNRYSRVASRSGMTAAQVARRLLDDEGLSDVAIERVHGKLSDHYDPRTNVIRLSDSVYGSASVGAVGVAAHEAGHAVQYAVGYGPIKLRTAILPACQFGSGAAPYLILLGLALSIVELYIAGIAAFILVAFFQLVTLPVEFNASRRALAALTTHGGLSESDRKGAKKVLTAAAMTYVAALVTSFMQILYYLSRLNRRRD